MTGEKFDEKDIVNAQRLEPEPEEQYHHSLLLQRMVLPVLPECQPLLLLEPVAAVVVWISNQWKRNYHPLLLLAPAVVGAAVGLELGPGPGIIWPVVPICY